MVNGSKRYGVVAAVVAGLVLMLAVLPWACAQDNSDADFQQKVLQKLDELSKRIDQLEQQKAEKRIIIRKSDENGDTSVEDLQKSLDALKGDLEQDHSSPFSGAEGNYRLELKSAPDGMVFVNGDSSVIGDITKALKDAAGKGEAKFEYKDKDWKVSGCKLDADQRKSFDELANRLKEEGYDAITIDLGSDGQTSVSVTKSSNGNSDVNVETKVFGDAEGHGNGGVFKLLGAKPLPDKVREKIEKLNKEHQEAIRKLLKENGLDEKDYPMLFLNLTGSLDYGGNTLNFDATKGANPNVWLFNGDGNVMGHKFQFDEKSLEKMQEWINDLINKYRSDSKNKEKDKDEDSSA